MEKYQMELNKVGVVAEKIKKIVEGRLCECINLEYCKDYIGLKIMNRDMCSYRKMIVQYVENKEVGEYVEEFTNKYFEDDYVPYIASELEIFIQDLLIENDCCEVHTDTNQVCFKGNDYLLEDITRFTYFPKLKSIVIETDLEICIIELDVDEMVTVDKERE